MAVPEGRNAVCFTLSCQRITSSGQNFARIGTNQQVCALGDGNGALRVLAQRKARDTESRGLFLDATRIGEDDLCFAQETEKIEVPDGRNEPQLRMMLDTALRQALLGARMNRKNDGHFGGNGIDRSEKLAELVREINIRRTMEGQDTETPPARSVLQS